MTRRIWCVLLMLCVLLCGCGHVPQLPDELPAEDGGSVADTPQGELVFALPYSHDDTLNPFSTATEANLQLASLLYDSLTVLTDGYVPVPSLAAEVVSTDATHLTVTLREDAVFSDGSAVTTDDVVKSFQAAQTSPNYQTLLSNVTAAKGDSKQRTVTFTLATADIHAASCLTFPIVKGSTLTDEAAEAPVGGGLYMLQVIDTDLHLVQNPYHPSEAHFSTVALRHLPNMAGRYYALASGQIAYYFDDLSGGEAARVPGAGQSVRLNTMVFVGINSTHTQLASPAVRQALSLSLDRAALAEYYGEQGVASAAPFSTEWQAMTECTSPSVAQDMDAAVALLTEAKYPTAHSPTLRLIYNEDRADRTALALLIAEQAKACGLNVEPTPLDEEGYRTSLAEGDYELYLGAYRFAADMSLRSLLLGGETSYGVSADSLAATDYRRYLAGEITLQEWLDVFSTDVPFIPLCFCGGVAAYDRRLTTVTPTGYDVYYGIAGWQ